jgi:hypothetical protein
LVGNFFTAEATLPSAVKNYVLTGDKPLSNDDVIGNINASSQATE